MPDTTTRRAALVEDLVTAGRLPDVAWQEAWRAVPREEFVPFYFVPHRGRSGWRLVEGDDEWLDGVYSNEALVTQLAGNPNLVDIARGDHPVSGAPTSSSSAPSLMAAMLDALDVDDSHRVLEAGTGSGYNAALLARRLCDDHVTSIEIDPTLSDSARVALDRTGSAPHLLVGDAATGAPGRAPFDRIIATLALPGVPSAWLAQTRPGAVLVVPLVAGGHGGLMVRLVRDEHGGAQGRVLDQYGGFMATRRRTDQDSPTVGTVSAGDLLPSAVPVDVLGGSHPASFFVSLLGPPFRTIGFTPVGETSMQTWGRGRDGGSFVVVEVDGAPHVQAEGHLWSHIAGVYRRWLDLGRPERRRVGLTVTSGGDHLVWLDDPRWTLRTWHPDTTAR